MQNLRLWKKITNSDTADRLRLIQIERENVCKSKIASSGQS